MTHKILVVDDEKLIQTLFKLRFKLEIEQQIYQFIFALNGVEALDKIAQNPHINLMLTDINMPKMDGLTLMGQLQEKLINIPTIVVSAYSDPSNQKIAKDLGAINFIVKPINFKNLDKMIQDYLSIENQ